VAQLKLPQQQFKARVVEGTCQGALRKLLDELDQRKWDAVPTFALLDPFGVKGLPFVLVERLLKKRLCEVLITFMTHTAQRWHSVLPDHINSLVGDPMAADKIGASPKKADTARALYQESLGSVARFVRYFHMRSHSDQPLYDLFFATQSDLGFLRMKQAMWDVDKTGSFKFSDASDPSQLVLLAPNPEQLLARLLQTTFRGRRVVYDEIERFVVQNTIYLPSHAKRALRTLEDPTPPDGHVITVDPIKRDGTKRRGHYFVNGTFVTFSDSPGLTP
jgi:hypothetical protein